MASAHAAYTENQIAVGKESLKGWIRHQVPAEMMTLQSLPVLIGDSNEYEVTHC